MKHFIYKSNFKQSLTEWARQELTEHQYNILDMLFNGFGCKQKLQNVFFELFRVGDGKYTLTIQKYIDDSWKLTFTINEKYANKNERFI